MNIITESKASRLDLSPISSRVTLEELSLQAEPLQEALRRARHDEVVPVPLRGQTVQGGPYGLGTGISMI